MNRSLRALIAGALLIAIAGASPVVAQDPPLAPPQATPLADPPRVPAGDGTGVRLTTDKGDIVIGLFTESAPVATENFLNLVNAGFYEGVTFHRLVPGFVIQGGDPAGDGTGGPGYTIRDEPVVGRYGRGIVAMARTDAPDSQGSQFFIVLDDRAEGALAQYNTYVIFGRVLEGMEVADTIAAMPNSGEPDNRALEPVTILGAAVESVTMPEEPIPGDPELEALLPTEINGSPLEISSTNGAELQAQMDPTDPVYDQIVGALATLGATFPDLSIGGGSAGDATGGVNVTALRVKGAEAAAIQGAMLPLLLPLDGTTSSTATVGGKEVTVVGAADATETDRYHVYGSADTIYVVQGSGEWLTEALAALP